MRLHPAEIWNSVRTIKMATVSTTSVHLPDGLGQNGGRVDLPQLGLLRPTLSDVPVEEMRRRLEEDGYLFVKGVIPREDVLDAREK